MRTYNITAQGEVFPQNISFAVGESVQFNFTVEDSDTHAPMDLSTTTVIMAISKVASPGIAAHPAIIARAASVTNPTAGLCNVQLAPIDTVPTDQTALIPGVYGIELWAQTVEGERDQSLGYGSLTLLPASFLPGDPYTAPPASGPGAPTPGGAQPIGIPTLWRGPNMGISGGIGASLNNSDPVLDPGGNDLEGGVKFTTDGNGAIGTIYWEWFFSSPRTAILLPVVEPMDDLTKTAIFVSRTPDIHVLFDSQGRAVGFSFGTLELLDANIGQFHVKVSITDAQPIVITKPQAMQNYQQWGGTSDPIAITLQVSGTHDIEYKGFDGIWRLFKSTATGTVNGTIPGMETGFGPLEFRPKDQPALMASVQVGVGDNIIAGIEQSNGVGQAPAQDYLPDPAGALPSLFRLDGNWSRLKDPSADNTNQKYTSPANATSFEGSTWVATFSALDAISPIFKARGRALCNCGQDSTTIGSDWAPTTAFDTTHLLGQLEQRAVDMGGVSQMWCWIGESDAIAGTSTSTFKAAFEASLNAVRAALDSVRANMGANMKVFCAKIMKITASGVQQTAIDAINLAYDQMLSDGSIQGIFDFSALVPSDGVVHVTTTAQAQECAGIAAAVVKSVMGY